MHRWRIQSSGGVAGALEAAVQAAPLRRDGVVAAGLQGLDQRHHQAQPPQGARRAGRPGHHEVKPVLGLFQGFANHWGEQRRARGVVTVDKELSDSRRFKDVETLAP